MSETKAIRLPLLTKRQIRVGFLLFVSIMMFPPVLAGEHRYREYLVWNDRFALDLGGKTPFYNKDYAIDWGWIVFCMVWYVIISIMMRFITSWFSKMRKMEKTHQDSKQAERQPSEVGVRK